MIEKQEKQPPQASLSRDLSHDLSRLLTAIPESVPQDDPDSIFINADKDYQRVTPEILYAYLRGDFEQVKRRYNGIEYNTAQECPISNDAAKLFASGAALAAAISMGDYLFFLEVENYLKNIVKEN